MEIDSTGDIQEKLDRMGESGGGTVTIPPGRYRVDGSLRVPSGVTLSGSWQAPHHATGLLGTVFEARGGRGETEGPALVELEPSSMVRGLTILYPEQTIPGTVPYPPTVRGRGMHATITDITMVNPWFGIDLTAQHELHHIRNIFGCPLSRGIVIDSCTDIGRVENVHFNPHYWDRSGADNTPDWRELLKYIWEHCEAFTISRSDWEYHLNTFSFGCRVGYRFRRSEQGACNGNFLGIAADWAWRALLVEHTQIPGLLVTNGEWVGGEGSDAMVETGPDFEGVLQLSNNSFWGPGERNLLVGGSGVVSMSQCNFCQWDHGGNGLPSIDVTGGSIIVQGSRFGEEKVHIRLRKEAKSAIVNGNLFKGAARIENEADSGLQEGLNTGF
jgi:hypothetical protein